jgi:hypothetical protein
MEANKPLMVPDSGHPKHSIKCMRYAFWKSVLFWQENRKELADNLDALKKRITGDGE